VASAEYTAGGATTRDLQSYPMSLGVRYDKKRCMVATNRQKQAVLLERWVVGSSPEAARYTTPQIPISRVGDP
jgi:hypothetical protein